MRLRLVLVLGFLCALAGCRGGLRQADQPIVLLVSLDGWRWDYMDRHDTPFLRALAARGVRADGLIPVFPSLTFPNHYTIVTGLRPAEHGIVSNTMVDPGIPQRFSLGDRVSMADPRWWGGEPIWNTGHRHGQKSGAMFWPGSDVAIGGQYPTYWKPFDHDLPAAARVDQVLAWLRLPESERPAFLTLYFSDVDSTGHDFGPESPELAAAVERLDRELARLAAGIDALGLERRVHWVVVSDHGMAELSANRVVVLDDYLDPATIDVVDWGQWLTLSPRTGSVDEAYKALAGQHPAFTVYRRDEMPERLGLAWHPRVAPIVGLADEGWTITTRARLAQREGRNWGGAHGYDPRFEVMHGIFVAAGPRLREGLRVDRFENVHTYNLMCAILGWMPAPNNGDPDVTARMLKP